jgi:hypothetical protein
VIHARRRVRRRIRRDGEHRVDHEIRRDDVEHRIGKPREIAKDAASERQDKRLRHPKALEPSGKRFLECALDDRRPHDRQRDVAVKFYDGVLRHRLRE